GGGGVGPGAAGRRPARRPPPRRGGPAPPAATPAVTKVTDRQLSSAAMKISDAEAVATPPLAELAGRLGLTRFERDTLFLCAAVELDPSITRLYALAQGDERLTHPTFGLALAVLPDPAWDVVSPQGGLRYWQLVEIARPPGQSLVGSVLRADERVVNHLKGLNDLDDRLTPLVERFRPGSPADLPPSQQAVADEIARTWRRPGAPVVQLVGADAPGKRLVAARAAAESGLLVCRLPAALLPAEPAALDHFARLWR
ncbi:hypothetical protein ACFV4F_43500, partial [Kitasatospora sp. NPDC059722]